MVSADANFLGLGTPSCKYYMNHNVVPLRGIKIPSQHKTTVASKTTLDARNMRKNTRHYFPWWMETERERDNAGAL